MSSERLLVVIDPSREQQPAVDRAAHLARKTGAPMTLFLTIFNFSYEKRALLSEEERELLRAALLEKHEGHLKRLVAPLQQEGLIVDYEIDWNVRVFESIIRYVLDHDVSYIVKSTQAHDTLKSVIFTPTDWHLIRKAPVPVLLVKEHDWPPKGVIIAAVDVDSRDPLHQELNTRIVNTAKNLAALIDGVVHLVNGYPGLPENMFIEQPSLDSSRFNKSVHQHHKEHVEALGAKFDISPECCHVKEGLPEDVISGQAKLLDAELVIIGTIGEQGITATLLGTTAEQVIDNLQCDLLALKPDQFRSPLA
ncbi:universal stress protein UspE [Ferrimonas sp. SCSIO 43195]|uniref:universal stress protein UspE n=1 Tax=Ferrimonas sp. SCSIO 43195 TaxID=2822844 RepID=UPI002075EC1D|nr:universal stress protein UspE [Ferrimonas sp. SCSIO 43195]USD35649.1 universal stress protein UspE [Ferrimonas sp. SCSIO 43195]